MPHWKKISLAVATLCGLVAAFALLAPLVGAGSRHQFVLYKLFGITRSSIFVPAFIVALIAAVPVLYTRWRHVLTLSAGKAALRRAIQGISETRTHIAQMPTRKFLMVCSIVLANSVVALVAVELLARLFLAEPSIYGASQPGQYYRFSPYLQSTNETNIDATGVWNDPINGKVIPYHLKSNNLGFRVERDFFTTEEYPKNPGEKVVLIFGGSAVYGFGNTSAKTTIAGHLQRLLDEQPSKYKYTVFNMGNGGWVSYQEFLALNLYGMNLRPDWIITMDGHNDFFTLPYVEGEDIGVHFSTMPVRKYLDGYLYQQPSPDFHRGVLENQLVKHSLLYRKLTGKRYVSPAGAPPRRTWIDVDKVLAFYFKTQRSILKECRDCSYILSTQPIYRPDHRLLTPSQMEEVPRRHKDIEFGPANAFTPVFDEVLMYMQTSTIQQMSDLCAAHRPACIYKAIDELFPAESADKKKYFVDGVHMNDEGNAVVAAYYAKQILAKDRALAGPKPRQPPDSAFGRRQ